jgi:transposase
MEVCLDSLPKTKEERIQLIYRLTAELSSYKEKCNYLVEQLRLAKQQRFSPSTEKNLLQADLFDEAGVELANDVKETIADQVEEVQRDGYKKKHPVRKPIPADLPREVVIHDLPASEKICVCGNELVRMGEEISEQVKYIPAKLSVIQHVRPKQENVKMAAMPQLFLPKSLATPELVAHILVAKYIDHIPLYRQETIWQRIGLDMPRSSLCGWIIKTAELCAPLIKQLHNKLIQYDYIQADESRLQVLNEAGRANVSKSTMWVYKSGNLVHPCVVFDYQETRGGYHAQNFLKGFKGYLQTDAYSGYNFTEQNEAISPLGCLAHARRPFAELAKLSKNTGLAWEALHYFQRLYAIEKQAREARLSHQQRYELRHQQAPPIFAEFKNWLETHVTKVPKQHKLGQGIQYTLRHWHKLTGYLKEGRLEIDNNAVENLIRPLALGRRNWLFAGSPTGA